IARGQGLNMRNAKLILAVAMLLFLAACNEGSDSGTGPGPGPGPGGDSLCGAPTFLFSPRFLPEDTDHTDVIRGLAVEGSDLFFTTFWASYRVPVAGGEPTRLEAHGGSLFAVSGRIFLV